jgi:tripeptidyl-peptidase I
VTASIIALLNDARLRDGKPALGFLNPLIYFYAYQGFTDITSGQSEGCTGNNTQTGLVVPGVSIYSVVVCSFHDLMLTFSFGQAGIIPGAHWNATVGWDPVTGFGVPNFGKLLELLGDI